MPTKAATDAQLDEVRKQYDDDARGKPIDMDLPASQRRNRPVITSRRPSLRAGDTIDFHGRPARVLGPGRGADCALVSWVEDDIDGNERLFIGTTLPDDIG